MRLIFGLVKPKSISFCLCYFFSFICIDTVLFKILNGNFWAYFMSTKVDLEKGKGMVW